MRTDISTFFSLDMSLPFMFASINVSPSHRMRLNVEANAMPLNAKEAIRGSPSPWKVLAMMPKQAAVRPKSVHDSNFVSVEAMMTRRTSSYIAIFHGKEN